MQRRHHHRRWRLLYFFRHRVHLKQLHNRPTQSLWLREQKAQGFVDVQLLAFVILETYK